MSYQAYPPQPGTVYFIGAGPGAPDLLTLRGRDLLAAADLVIYADSLVDAALTDFARPGTQVVGSSTLTLEQMTELEIEAARAGKVVVRLQSGDPAVYGAMHEQIAALSAAEVRYVVVPGVSSAFAAAAALGIELTVPEVAQTVIFTRAQGRASAVPDRESLRSLAAHRTSLALFLSAAIIDRAVAELIEGGYPPETPAAVAYRVSWPDERVIACSLGEVEAIVRAEKMTRSALVLVGDALAGPAGAKELRSRLYDGTYTHLFRTGTRE
jgi:precorrin-4/cobalt-precorrin-4 C11-methyltransferase